MLGLAAAQLLAHNENAIPAESRESIRTWRRSQALFTLNMTAEMFRLFDSFISAGIEALVIKGPVLSARCYGDAGLRQYGDLDLIARDKDILRVTELMLDLGYDANIPVAAIRAGKIPGEYNFRQRSAQLLVEFHTERTFRYHPKPLPIEELFERQARVKFDAREIPALSPEDELILICVHGAKHFWERLIYIADVAAFVSHQELSWPKLDSAASEVGARRMLAVGLRLSAEVLGAHFKDQGSSSGEAFTQSEAIVGKLTQQVARWLPAAGSVPPGILNRAIFRLRMHGKPLAALAYLLKLSFSPTEEDWAKGAEDKRPWLLDAVGRPFRLARKYGRAGKD